MWEKQIYVITGGPGFGKTDLIDRLRKLGYLCSDEFAREIIEVQQKCGGEILPWKNGRLFQQEVLSKRIAFYDSVPAQSIAFADRGIPDQLAFARYKGFSTSVVLSESVLTYRYAPIVFVTPPWPEIYTNDAIRTESYEDAFLIHKSILDTYTELNYQIIHLPLVAVEQRSEFILQTIQKTNTNGHQST